MKITRLGQSKLHISVVLMLMFLMTPSIHAQDVLTAADLAGDWIGENYTCDGKWDLLIRIDVYGEKVIATKVTGEHCVAAGEVTWKGTFAKDRFPVKFRVGRPPEKPLKWIDAVVEIVDRNTLKARKITFRRKKEQRGRVISSLWVEKLPVATHTFPHVPHSILKWLLTTNSILFDNSIRSPIEDVGGTH
ncbi:MAG: hypothetical protein GKS05_09050 [Nitrospirales bacterium]|nr:hypothetical protein [Nitrospirales bacterium]